MEALVDAQGLVKCYGSLTAVDGVSLRVERGEIYGLVGPDGAGKTTILRLLCGALRLSAGTVRIAGYDLSDRVEAARSVTGYLPQRFSLYEDLTVLENIRFFAEVRGLPPEEWKPRCMEILQFVALDEFADRRAGQLSGGMKQKLGLAAALVHRPRILLLDEPTTGVDPVTRQDFWRLIIHLVNEEGVGVLISTPYMDEAARCSRVGLMSRGRILVEAPPAEIAGKLKGRIIELVGPDLPGLRSLSRQIEGVENVQMFGDRLHLRTSGEPAGELILRLAQHLREGGAGDIRLREIDPQLEDAFIQLLEEET